MIEYDKINHYPTHIMLNLTDACNLACKYCFVEQKPNFMSLQTAKDITDWAYNNYLEQCKFEKKQIQKNIKNREDAPCSICFFGGEPLLLYDEIIVPLVEYIEKKYNNLFKFDITTNVTLLTKEKVDFFVKHDIIPLLSLDGNEITQNFNRPCIDTNKNSFDLIKNNLSYILEKFPKDILCARSTVYAPTCDQLFNNYIYFEQLGFRAYNFIPDVRSHRWTEQEFQILKQELIKIFNYRLDQIQNNIQPMYCQIFHRIEQTILNYNNPNFLENTDKLSSCGIGTLTAAVGWDGSIYGCQQEVSRDKNIFYIGNIYENGIDKDLHLKLLEKFYNEYYLIQKNKCKTCYLLKHCLFLAKCPSSQYFNYNNFYEESTFYCNYWNLLFNYILIELNYKLSKKLETENKE